MKGKAVIPLILGLVIGLLAVKLTVDAIQKARADSEEKSTITVVRAKEDLEAYQEIRPEMVEAIETVDSPFTPAAERIEAIELVKGRVTSKPIPKGSPILSSMLAPEGTPAGMVGRIPAGYRAVSVKIDEVSGVAYQIQPGDWVDVIVVMDIDVGARKKETIAEVILQHVQVAAVGRGTSESGTPANDRMKPAKSATLLVEEEDAPKLHLAATRGKITLSLRGEDETSTGVAHGARDGDIFGQLRSLMAGDATPTPTPAPVVEVKQPLALPPPPFEVAIYRGAPRGKTGALAERITFENANSPNIIEVAPGNPTRSLNTMDLVPRRRPQPTPPAPPETIPENIEDSETPED